MSFSRRRGKPTRQKRLITLSNLLTNSTQLVDRHYSHFSVRATTTAVPSTLLPTRSLYRSVPRALPHSHTLQPFRGQSFPESCTVHQRFGLFTHLVCTVRFYIPRSPCTHATFSILSPLEYYSVRIKDVPWFLSSLVCVFSEGRYVRYRTLVISLTTLQHSSLFRQVYTPIDWGGLLVYLPKHNTEIEMGKVGESHFLYVCEHRANVGNTPSSWSKGSQNGMEDRTCKQKSVFST